MRDTQSKKMLPIETFVVAMKTITVTVAILKGEYLLFVNWVHADQRQVRSWIHELPLSRKSVCMSACVCVCLHVCVRCVRLCVSTTKANN